ncbi:PREDICTED: uncharacterized protein LOC104587962 [Nelumbo nucifera]|uniref:Dof zinc finger protein n=1 Tax=Nelumbo nucifera TaxID=4432 RepID=A0A1U7YX59_NELNU|nr:PREDICTED: uncharacterized protein LOC104587962 [Nelumbo nucifera]
MVFTAGEKMIQSAPGTMTMDRRWKPTVELAPNCPRCASPNTKFCYYNNYSLSQPRYFCKGCRRYWTKGGSLRNVPVGGGCRKTRRAKSARLPQTEPTSMFLRCTQPSSTFSRESQPSDGKRTVAPTTEPTDVSNIDLAAVFAKFVSENSCFDSGFAVPELSSENEMDASFNLSSSLNSNEIAEDHNVVEWQRPSDVALQAHFIEESPSPQMFPDDQFEFNYKQQEERISHFTVQDLSSFEFPPLVSDGIDHGALWSDAPSMPNFTWQPAELQKGIESFPSNDHLTTFHPNLQNDNWSSFDLPSYEAFSRP